VVKPLAQITYKRRHLLTVVTDFSCF